MRTRRRAAQRRATSLPPLAPPAAPAASLAALPEAAAPLAPIAAPGVLLVQRESPAADARELALPDRYKAKAAPWARGNPPAAGSAAAAPPEQRSIQAGDRDHGVTPLGFALLHLQLRGAYAEALAGVGPADVGLEALGVPAALGTQGVLEGAAWALASLGLASQGSTTEPPPPPGRAASGAAGAGAGAGAGEGAHQEEKKGDDEHAPAPAGAAAAVATAEALAAAAAAAAARPESAIVANWLQPSAELQAMMKARAREPVLLL
jgi:hypothetical protein